MAWTKKQRREQSKRMWLQWHDDFIEALMENPELLRKCKEKGVELGHFKPETEVASHEK